MSQIGQWNQIRIQERQKEHWVMLLMLGRKPQSRLELVHGGSSYNIVSMNMVNGSLGYEEQQSRLGSGE